jgi:hypothetical protein
MSDSRERGLKVVQEVRDWLKTDPGNRLLILEEPFCPHDLNEVLNFYAKGDEKP